MCSTAKPSNGADGGSSHGQSLASLVDAVVQMGGASEALQSLRKHLATQVFRPSAFTPAHPVAPVYHHSLNRALHVGHLPAVHPTASKCALSGVILHSLVRV